MRPSPLSQRGRFVLLLCEVAALLVVSYLAQGRVFPAPGGTGFWFYIALLGLVMGSRLDTPHYVKPADVVLYAAPAAISLLLESSWSKWHGPERLAFVVALGYAIAIGAVAVVAILAQSREHSGLRRTSATAKVIAEHLGTPRLIFSFVLVFAVVTFHRNSPRETLLIISAWVVMVWMNPVELAATVIHAIRKVFNRELAHAADGEAVAYHAPGILLVRANATAVLRPHDLLAIRDGGGMVRVAMALDEIGHAEGTLWRALEIPEARRDADITARVALLQDESFAVIRPDRKLAESPFVKDAGRLVGLVAENTSVHELFFDLLSPDGVEEGRLVGVRFNGRTVLYQVVNGLTRDDVVFMKAKLGYVRAQARKVGAWDAHTHRFRHAKWIPPVNAPVLLENASQFVHVPEVIGHFPDTAYGVRLRTAGAVPAGLNTMVTHNTAILGILGVGKTSLAIELLERMMVAGTKVICIDLTNQYSTELGPWYHPARHEKTREILNKVGAAGKDVVSKNVHEGGSRRKFAAKLQVVLGKFIAPAQPLRLLVLNPAEYEVWQQDSKSYQGEAAMSMLTPAQITQLITEGALAAVAGLGMTDQARLCLVFEEAHSLVPEWNSAVHEGDKSASNGTARAILQGRKYGMGCLLISQRTANVSKTILNQCNTVFAMRTFDDTGKEFLANYLGKEFATILPSLEERHAVFFGRGSSCENPVMLRLNDRERWLATFRALHPPPPLPEDRDAEAAAEQAEQPGAPADAQPTAGEELSEETSSGKV